MSKHVFVVLSLLGLSLASHNGGSNCAACSIVTGMLHQHAKANNLTGSEAFTHLCDLQPAPLSGICHKAQERYSDQFDLDNLTELDDQYTRTFQSES